MVHGCRLQGGLQAARLRSGAPSGPAAIVARLEAELHKGSGGSRGICNHRSPVQHIIQDIGVDLVGPDPEARCSKRSWEMCRENRKL